MYMKKEKKKNSGAGFYIALCCCVAAMSIVGFVNSKKDVADKSEAEDYIASYPEITITPINEEEYIETAAQKVIEEEPEKEKSENSKPEKSVDADIIEAGENHDFYDGEVVESVSIADKPEFIMPVNGTVCCDYSDGKLVYDTVMEDYRAHNGIDIKADADTDVLAADDGVIEAVYNDTLGKAVIIDHGNGYKTKYANLDDIENLEEGMELKKGDFIAHVGTYKYGESTTDAHIHFEIINDNEFCNPAEFFKYTVKQ